MKAKAASAETGVAGRVAKAGIKLLGQGNDPPRTADDSARFRKALEVRARAPFEIKPFLRYRDFGINE